MSLCPILGSRDPGLDRWLNRRPGFDSKLVSSVAEIIDEVSREGAEAVLRHSRRYDSPALESLFVTPEEIQTAVVSTDELEALRLAISRVQEFHETQKAVITKDWQELPIGYGWRTDATESDDPGFEGQRLLPLASAGIYVPGGRANYPSSVIMNVIPAQVAGVQRIVVATPVGPDGTIAPAVLVAARLLGIQTILKAGGASAIAALALGIDDLPRVDKIVGPGNAYVNEAKRQLWGSVGLDGYAGPSEVAVYVDDENYTDYAAADLLTQIEHAPDNVGMLIAPNQEVIDETMAEIENLLIGQKHEETMRRALKEQCVAVISESALDAIRVINDFAPEHLSLICESAAAMAQGVVNCGCVLIGAETPQSCGDFISGPSHTLPTAGAARFGSPVNVQDFFKFQSVSSLTMTDLEILNPAVQMFGQMEGFPMHALGTQIRLDE